MLTLASVISANGRLRCHPVSPFSVLLFSERISSCRYPSSFATPADKASKGRHVLLSPCLSFYCSACTSCYTRSKGRHLKRRTKARPGCWPTGNRWTTASSSPPRGSFLPSPLLYCKSAVLKAHSFILSVTLICRPGIQHTHCETQLALQDHEQESVMLTSCGVCWQGEPDLETVSQSLRSCVVFSSPMVRICLSATMRDKSVLVSVKNKWNLKWCVILNNISCNMKVILVKKFWCKKSLHRCNLQFLTCYLSNGVKNLDFTRWKLSQWWSWCYPVTHTV